MDQALLNIISHLQIHDLAYRHFGPYWWRLKAILKAAGFNEEALPHLGPNDEPATRERWDDIPPEEFLPIALEEQMANAQFFHLSSWTTDPETGDPYFLYDEDVGR